MKKLAAVMCAVALLILQIASCEQAVWDCPGCGRTGNMGNYCGKCRHPAPWIQTEATENPQSTDTATPDLVIAPDILESIPTLSHLYPGIQTKLNSIDGRWYPRCGPGDDYAGEIGGYKSDDDEHWTELTVYFCENGWYFTDVNYYSTGRRFVYLPPYSVESAKDIPDVEQKSSAADYYEGKTIMETIPLWGPDDSLYQTCEEYRINKDTGIKVFFRENDYVYAEFPCAQSNVRMWLPISNIIFDQSSLQVGSIVTFGHYEQDNNEENGKEAIEWYILDVQDNKALLISKDGLDSKPYHDTLEFVSWDTCSLRKWLNNDFMDAAFCEEEKGLILETATDSSNPDRIFLLSSWEADLYFDVNGNNTDNRKARISPSEYAIINGAGTDNDYKTEAGRNAWWWWLRTIPDYSYTAAAVASSGKLDSCIITRVRDGNKYGGCVRPALWIDIGANISGQ